MRVPAALFAAIGLLAGCVSGRAVEPPIIADASVGLTRLAADSSGEEMQALGHGVLALDDGCWRLVTRDGPRLIVWRSTARLDESGRGVRDDSTGHGVRVGDAIVIGGGEVDRVDPTRLDAPTRCQGPAWIAGRGFFKAPEENWRTVRMSGPYTVKLPPDMLQVPTTGIDSLVDVHVSPGAGPGLRLTFDYGAMACGTRGAETPDDLRVSTTFVDQRPVEISRYSEPADAGRRIHRLEARMAGVDLPRRSAPGVPHRACLTFHAQCETARDCDVARGIVSTLWIGPISREEAIDRVIAEYPELEAYRTRSLPPHSIEAQSTSSGDWQIAFVRSGSGIRSVLDASCFSVSRFGEVRPAGSWRRIGRDVARIDPATCRPAG